MFSKNQSLFKFIAFSLLLHAVVIGTTFFSVSKDETVAKFELSLRRGEVRIGEIKLPPKRRTQLPKQKTEAMPQETAASEPRPEQLETASGPSQSQEDNARARYGNKVSELINKHKHYPRMARTLRQEGRVMVKLKLDKDGKILELKILDKPRYQSLANASLETIKSVHQFPPIPEELRMEEISFNIPIDFILTN